MAPLDQKREFLEEFQDVKTRQDALRSISEGSEETIELDLAVDPFVHRAADHLINNVQELDIELLGLPYDVLEQAAEQLREKGISSRMAAPLLSALENHIIKTGAEFSQGVKAKPLYVRFLLTDKRPDDLPDCEHSQSVFLDGVQTWGNDAATVGLVTTLFGTKMTKSNFDLDNYFTGKRGLFIDFRSPGNMGVGEFDNNDNNLMTIMQAIAGADMSPQAKAELIQMVQDGELSSEAMSILENLATLSQLQEVALDPNMAESVELQISELTQEITEQLSSDTAQSIPASIIEVAAQTEGVTEILAENAQQGVHSTPIDPDSVEATTLQADNENVAPTDQESIDALIEQLQDVLAVDGLDQTTIDSIQTQIDSLQATVTDGNIDLATTLSEVKTKLASIASETDLPVEAFAQISETLPTISAIEHGTVDAIAPLVDQTPELATLGAEELREVIQQLSAMENPPPEIAQLLAQLDGIHLTPQAVEVALAGRGEMADTITAIATTLSEPAVQNILPADIASSVQQLTQGLPALVEAIATQSTIAALENVDTTMLDGAQAQEIQTIVEGLKSGEIDVASVDTAILAEAATQLGDSAPPTLTEAIATIDTAQTAVEGATPDVAGVNGTVPEAVVEGTAPEVVAADGTAPEAVVEGTSPDVAAADSTTLEAAVEGTTPEVAVTDSTTPEAAVEGAAPEVTVADSAAPEAAVDVPTTNLPDIGKEFSGVKEESTVIHAAEIFTEAAEHSGKRDIGVQHDADIIDLQQHREVSKAEATPELAIANIPTKDQTAEPTAKADFDTASPPTGERTAPLQLDKDITSPPEAVVTAQPEHAVKTEPETPKAADPTAPVTNYEPQTTEADTPAAPDKNVAGHPIGCKCPQCSGAAVVTQEADLTANNNTALDTSEPESSDELGIPATPKDNAPALRFGT